MRYAWARALFLMLAISAVCCRPRMSVQAGNYVLDPGFTPAQREAIADAFEAWNKAAPECANFFRPAAGGIRVHRARGWWDMPEGALYSDGSMTLGMWDRSTNSIYLWVDYWAVPAPIAWRTLAAHEIGHAIGLAHEAHGLMAPSPRWDALEHGNIPDGVADRARQQCHYAPHP